MSSKQNLYENNFKLEKKFLQKEIDKSRSYRERLYQERELILCFPLFIVGLFLFFAEVFLFVVEILLYYLQVFHKIILFLFSFVKHLILFLFILKCFHLIIIFLQKTQEAFNIVYSDF